MLLASLKRSALSWNRSNNRLTRRFHISSLLVCNSFHLQIFVDNHIFTYLTHVCCQLSNYRWHLHQLLEWVSFGVLVVRWKTETQKKNSLKLLLKMQLTDSSLAGFEYVTITGPPYKNLNISSSSMFCLAFSYFHLEKCLAKWPNL